MALKGYVNHHSEFCPLDDCPLRNFKRQLMKDQKASYGQFGPVLKQASTHSVNSMTVKGPVTNLESPALLLSHAKNLYTNGTKVCPDSVPLRIDYAYFLLTK